MYIRSYNSTHVNYDLFDLEVEAFNVKKNQSALILIKEKEQSRLHKRRAFGNKIFKISGFRQLIGFVVNDVTEYAYSTFFYLKD